MLRAEREDRERERVGDLTYLNVMQFRRCATPGVVHRLGLVRFPTMRTPGATRLLPLLAALLSSGCGSGAGPPAAPVTRVPEAERYRVLQEAQGDDGAQLEELFRSAAKDPNEFLRGMALQALAKRHPPGDPPAGFRVELRRAVQEDPDLNRRCAAILLLHFEGAAALEQAAAVYHSTENPETAHAVALAGADALQEAALVKHWQDESDAIRRFVHEVIRLRTRRREGLHVGPRKR